MRPSWTFPRKFILRKCLYGMIFPQPGDNAPIPCQRSHLPPSAFPKLEGESGARPGGRCQGLSLITIRVRLINLPRGHRPCLARPPSIPLWRGSVCRGAGGKRLVHTIASSDHAWPGPPLSSPKPFLCPAPRVPSADLCISSLSRSTVQNRIIQAQSPAGPVSQASVGRCLWAIL